MPNLLNNLIDPAMQTTNYPGREALLSKALGGGHAAPSPLLRVQEPVRQPSRGAGVQNFIKLKAQEREKNNVQKALNEIITTRNKAGKKFLNPTERLGILTKHVSPQVANQINSTITAEQTKAEPKYYSSTWIDPATGETRTGLKTGAELKRPGGIVTKRRSRKEKLLEEIGSGARTIESLTPSERFIAGVKVPKEKKPEYDLKNITDYWQKNAYDKDGAFLGLDSTQEATIEDMITKAGVSWELAEETLPAEAGTWLRGFFGIGKPALEEETAKMLRKKRKKGAGFLGTLKNPKGGVSTEISIGVNIDGKETEIPTLVPTLTEPEIDHLLSGKQPSQAIVSKAVKHAKDRIGKGKSPFYQEGEKRWNDKEVRRILKQSGMAETPENIEKFKAQN